MKPEKRKEYNLKQLNIEVPQEIMEHINTVAAKRNIPKRTWILRALINALRKENL